MSKEEKAASDPLEGKLIRDLAAILDETGLSEIEIEKSGLRVRVARMVQMVAAAPAASIAAAGRPAGQPAAPKSTDISGHPGLVASPMVGTAYVAPTPGAPTFVKVGDMVTEGQTLLIIEAMKTMNQIPAPRAGRVTQVIISDGQPVEFGEPLMIIE
ncbi:MAG: acetyl-CoA carboxylase biotin carboxyl carrier protein [Alphaproteobacteria bacterium]|nr:acetyl-CoA carboxylase biotin carboxyl carrier protein [Alphaproteobacteria bacterium]